MRPASMRVHLKHFSNAVFTLFMTTHAPTIAFAGIDVQVQIVNGLPSRLACWQPRGHCRRMKVVGYGFLDGSLAPVAGVLSPSVPMLAEGDEKVLDPKDIKGQESAKRALEVAAAGGHNLLMWGPITLTIPVTDALSAREPTHGIL
nr:ATP-binding protein [Magnetospirillum gryphiswaldense]